ncbi:MAG: hypothetical protein WAM30_07980, partial [Candidatus Dormiibacterota bacterium]
MSLLLWGRLLTPSEDCALGWVRVERDRIAGIGPGEPRPERCGDVDEVRGGPDHVVAPGFRDLQVNGIGGLDAADGAEAIAAIAERLPARGVTAFCPTVISAPLEHLL